MNALDRAARPALAEAVRALADHRGAPAAFWADLAGLAAVVTGGAEAAIWRRGSGEAQGWSRLAGPETAEPRLPRALLGQVRREGAAIGAGPDGVPLGLALLRLEDKAQEVVLCLRLPGAAGSDGRALGWLMALGWVPLAHERDRAARQGRRDAARLAQTLELVGRLLEAPDFDAACLAFANDLSVRFAAEQATVSWRGSGGLRLRAISHAEKVDRRSELSALIEEAGQEALTQEAEILWPGHDRAVRRAHDRYAQLQHPGHMVTLPLIDPTAEPGRGNLGAVTLERQRMAFGAGEVWALRLCCELALRPLLAHHARTRLLPVRLGAEIARSLPAMLRPRTANGRRLALAATVAVALLAAVPVPFSVSGAAAVRSDRMAFVGAPFDGYIAEGHVRLGDHVVAGAPLFSLVTRELELERAAHGAELAQAAREADIRRSLGQYAEMQIAEARIAELEAKILRTEGRLEAAVARAPIAGVVVEGEPSKSIGGAVRRGDPVVTVVAVDALRVEAMVPERDLDRVARGQTVRVTFIAQPHVPFAMAVERIVPAPEILDGENAFPIRLDGAAPAEWWLPGMTGVSRIEIGWRPLAWVATHRLVDYLRLLLWV